DPAGRPQCLMEASYLSAARTAAVNLLAARYLCSTEPESLGFVGAGVQARFHLQYFLDAYPSITRIVAFNRTEERLGSLRKLCDRRFDAVQTPDEAASADIVVCATTTANPLLIDPSFAPGATLFQFSGHESAFEVVDKMDEVWVDDWSAIRHRGN